MSNDDKTGYGKPPKHTQFKRGQSGNPRGRPKKTSPDLTSILLEELDREVVVKDTGERITAETAVIRQLIAQAAKGKIPAIKLLLSFLQSAKEEKEISIPRMVIHPPAGPPPPIPPIYGVDDVPDK